MVRQCIHRSDTCSDVVPTRPYIFTSVNINAEVTAGLKNSKTYYQFTSLSPYKI